MPAKKKPASRKKTAPSPKADLGALAAKALAGVTAGASSLGKIVATAFTIPKDEPAKRPRKAAAKRKPKSAAP